MLFKSNSIEYDDMILHNIIENSILPPLQTAIQRFHTQPSVMWWNFGKNQIRVPPRIEITDNTHSLIILITASI